MSDAGQVSYSELEVLLTLVRQDLAALKTRLESEFAPTAQEGRKARPRIWA